jgi:hypothetical protein
MDVSVVMASRFELRMAGILYAALRARALAAQPLHYIGDAARSGGVALGGENGFGELPSNRRRHGRPAPSRSLGIERLLSRWPDWAQRTLVGVTVSEAGRLPNDQLENPDPICALRRMLILMVLSRQSHDHTTDSPNEAENEECRAG